MPIKDEISWKEWVDKNPTGIGRGCVDTARRVMELLDEEKEQPLNPQEVIVRASKELQGESPSWMQAGYIAQIVIQCHSRGEEFREAWNKKFPDSQIKKGAAHG